MTGATASTRQRWAAVELSKRLTAPWLLLSTLGAVCSCTAYIDGASPTSSSAGGSSASAAAGSAGVNVSDPAKRDQSCNPPEARIWRLTPLQLERTLSAALPGVKGVAAALDTSFIRGQSFGNQADLMQMPEPHVTALFQVAKRVSQQLAEDPAALSPCLGEALPKEACVSEALATLGGRLFRAPVSEPESTSYLRLYREQSLAYGKTMALRQMLAALLMSPRSLYRYELGPEGAASGQAVAMTPFEKASALAYFLSDGPPDEQLQAAARSGSLETPAQLGEQAARLARRASARGVEQFFEEYLRVDGVVHKNPDATSFPNFKRELLDAMADESRAFVSHVLFDADARFETLLTANFSVVSPELALHYAAVPAPTSGQPVTLPAPRAGLLTQGSFLAQWALDKQTDIVRRGKFVRLALLCQNLPPPPENVDVTPPEVSPGTQQREVLAQHSKVECAGCHALMDPIGVVFEQFDAVGAFRNSEAGRPISTASIIPQIDGADLSVAGPQELAAALARSPQAQACFVSTLYQYAHGRRATGRDICSMDAVRQTFTQTHGDVLKSVVSIVSDDNFFKRVAP